MKLAVMLNNLGPSQLAYNLVLQANALVGSRSDLDVVALYESLCRPCISMNFASMQVVEGWGFDGPVVATSFSTAEKLIRFPAASKKLFLVWDLEWLRVKEKSFRQQLAVYGNTELTLLSRSKDHAKAISDCWNRESLVVEDFDLARIIEVATGEKLAVE